MLAQLRNEHASEYQTVMCIYLLACGATRSQFEVLNHAGITMSYRTAVRKLKELGQQGCEKLVRLAHTIAFMLIWDNLNFAFRAAQQRADSKDHFDSGTTGTLVPLFDIKYGELTLDLLPRRETRLPTLKFSRDEDLLPSLQQCQEMEDTQLWHIKQTLYTFFPRLLKQFPALSEDYPTVLQIPIHRTEQYPIPAMHIDESSLDGTIDIVGTILGRALHMSSEDIERHGVIIFAGDQLSISLFDKVCLVLELLWKAKGLTPS